MFKDLSDFINFLEEKNELVRISTPVSSEFEITEIADRTIKSKGPALLFENVDGQKIPVLINLFGSEARMAWALGIDSLNDLSDISNKLINLPKNPPKSLMEKLKILNELINLSKSSPKILKNAPCQDIVLKGDEINLFELPILKCWPGDAGKFITLPLVITRNLNTGQRNVGTYRMQVYDERTTGMHWQTHKVGTSHYRKAKDFGNSKLEVAVAIGGDPVTIWSGSLPLPPDMDELLVAGILKGSSVELVKCKTVDLEVPANSEFVLEGYIDVGEERIEGPFGDHTGFYSEPAKYPVFHLTALTRKTNPIYPAVVVGKPPSEDYFMGKASSKLMLPALQLTLPEIIDVNMPAEGLFHNFVIVSMKKEYPGHVRKVMYGLWGLGLMSLTKIIIVVDHYVDVEDISEVAWRIGTNVDPGRDLVIVKGPTDDLDHASEVPKYGGKMGIDATSKGELDGFNRDWPDEIMMTDEIKKLVDKKWTNYRI
ncbi:MAG: menaquinone biosynthesis decarboxylase [SAR202 cluster bacterium]|nr:menaquinone biosynthesis decarboxylase [Chloroflexota bacterium]MQG38807.1 menaquinone biosynthesis decarboxylase [SAR202 cluster bacterium]|tara:strand:- start:4066 stop:5517 length:1452 start_codon:yes stop_codon:yes gene_type:complete